MGLFCLLLCIGVIYLRPADWIPVVSGWPLMDVLIILAGIFITKEIVQSRKYVAVIPQILLLMAFWLCILFSDLSQFYLGDVTDSSSYLSSVFNSFIEFSKIVIIFCLLVNGLNSIKKLKIAVWLIIVLSVVLAIQGIQQKITGIGWAGQGLVQDRIIWVGIFGDPNDFAQALIMPMGFLLAFIFSRSKMAIKILSIGLASVLLLAIYHTNSRGGFLAVAVTAMYFFLIKIKNRALAISLGAVVLLLIVCLRPSRVAEISTVEDASSSGRIGLWYEGIQLVKKVPIFGIGYNNFTDYHRQTAHNSYILVAAEEGLLGFWVWIAFIYACFKGLFLIRDDNLNWQPYHNGLEVNLISFFCSAYFLSSPYVSIFYIMLALATAFACVHGKRENFKFGKKDIKRTGFLSIGILLSIWLSIKIYVRFVG